MVIEIPAASFTTLATDELFSGLWFLEQAKALFANSPQT